MTRSKMRSKSQRKSQRKTQSVITGLRRKIKKLEKVNKQLESRLRSHARLKVGGSGTWDSSSIEGEIDKVEGYISRLRDDPNQNDGQWRGIMDKYENKLKALKIKKFKDDEMKKFYEKLAIIEKTGNAT